MRTIRRTLVASALALPLTLGAAGIASADTYGSTEVQAGPDGAATHSVQSDTHRGSSSFHENSAAAGPDGAAHSSTSATAGENGDSQYRQHSGWAGQDGAGSSETHSSTDGGSDQGVLSGTLGAIGL
ncbi:hypothetical protein AB0E55_24800 [Amycolatopsis keratiniphila]|uniref:Secreted protein n=1 Tax=Amycolatopsis keratiniphila TaxID=129921 RepID=R4TCA2_9PSEU|nr:MULTISPECIES: hypothetical protein [Amycolatopsis]AGM09866.1 hypothetical protein AORI_7284 [Amycolatopsis keratiniphila]